MGAVLPIAAAVGTVVSAAGSIYGGFQAANQYEYNAAVARQEAKFQDQKTEVEIAQHEADVKRLLARQSVVAGASGSEVASGTNLSILTDTRNRATIDQQIIRYGGDINAWRADAQADILEDQVPFFKTAGFLNAGSTILNSASQWDWTNMPNFFTKKRTPGGGTYLRPPNRGPGGPQ